MENLLELNNIWKVFDGVPVLKGLDISLAKGEVHAILGGNGSGKTTALKLLAGIKKPYLGRVNAYGRIGVLPQEPRMLFSKDTVREEIASFAAHAFRADQPVKHRMRQTRKLSPVRRRRAAAVSTFLRFRLYIGAQTYILSETHVRRQPKRDIRPRRSKRKTHARAQALPLS